MFNLEPICAKYGHRMINTTEKAADQENTLTKALGVLAESGLYAMCVFLLSCHKKEYGEAVLTRHLHGLWTDERLGILPADLGREKANILQAVRGITDDLHKLILTRRITEQALIFARYHAKAEVPMPEEEA